MLAQIAQQFAAIDRRSNGSHRVSLVYNAASNPNPNPIPLLLPQSLLPSPASPIPLPRSAAPTPTLPRRSTSSSPPPSPSPRAPYATARPRRRAAPRRDAELLRTGRRAGRRRCIFLEAKTRGKRPPKPNHRRAGVKDRYGELERGE
jgi:hypothetical protein